MMVLLINMVLDYDRKVATAEGTESEFINTSRFLVGKEFSTVLYDNGFIYAGGAKGLFSINVDTNEYKEIMNIKESFRLVRGIVLSGDNILWVGHNDGVTGIELNSEELTGIIQQFNENNGLIDPRVNDLKFEQDYLYIATYSGIGIIKGVSSVRETEVKWLCKEQGLIKDITKTILLDSNNRLWCGSYTSTGGGVTMFEDRVDLNLVTYFTTETGLSHNAITTIVEDECGNIWIGNGCFTEGGASLFSYEEDQWTLRKTLTTSEGLIGDKIRHIYIDKGENIWFCSESEGIAVLKPTGYMIYLTKEQGLSDNEVKKITSDDQGNLWLASRSGITKIEKQWLEEHIYNE